MDTKQCRDCGLHKPRTDYYKHQTTKDRLYPSCKSCHAAQKREYHASNPFRKAVDNAKRRAKDAGVPFDIDEEYLSDIWTGVCPAFKTRMGLPHLSKDHDTSHRPSLDRIIPERGYVKGNVIWISIRANNVKNDATYQQLYAVADWLHQTMKEIEQHETR